MIKVLIVDDSATMRAILRDYIEADPDIRVVGEAADPIEARAAIKLLNPDIITLDINMPRMSGLDFLEKLMKLRPTPALIISGENGKVRSNVLNQGAVGFISKPSCGEFDNVFGSISQKIRSVLREFRQNFEESVGDGSPNFQPNNRIVAIGASTGGVDALLAVLREFPENCPPTVITQHMPSGFTSSFAMRIDRNCAPRAREITDGDLLEAGNIYLAPGSETHLEVTGTIRPMCRLTHGPLFSGHRPSVDKMFDSMASLKDRGVGVILTGMGKDGAQGLLNMRNKGAITFAQDRKSSLVYGMPRAAYECGAVQKVLPLRRIAREVLAVCCVGGNRSDKL